MNKTEMAMKLAKKTGLSQGKSAEILDALFSAHSRKGSSPSRSTPARR
jgi:nucleoid DNA-binding protein